MPDLSKEFQGDMFQVYHQAKQRCHYNAVMFLSMLNRMGGVLTAKRLLSAERPQYGFAKLWECGRLDLTVECLVLRERYQVLFDESELDEARRRLRANEFDPAHCEC